MSATDNRDRPETDITLEALHARLDALEVENARLKKSLRGFGLISDNPSFDSMAFQKALAWYTGLLWAPISIMLLGVFLLGMRIIPVPLMKIGPLPLFDPGGVFGVPGMGIGIIAMGGLALGVVAVGGGAVGIFACGGGSAGIVALGGGAIGVFAFGGGSVGVIAMGGGAFGYYSLCARGGGKYVFSLTRQDPEAVAFWTRIFPKFKNAMGGPMPVIPLDLPQ